MTFRPMLCVLIFTGNDGIYIQTERSYKTCCIKTVTLSKAKFNCFVLIYQAAEKWATWELNTTLRVILTMAIRLLTVNYIVAKRLSN